MYWFIPQDSSKYQIGLEEYIYFQGYFLSNTDDGGTSSWIGDGFCDDLNTNEACDYDNGDCCGLSAKKNFCVDCSCKGKSKGFELLKENNSIIFFFSIYMQN